MTYPLVQFVSAPEPNAEVRFDFNNAGEWADEETWPEHENFSLGVPPLEGDPDGYAVEYGLRQLSFNIVIEADARTAFQRMSQLSRELQRRTNWLLFRFSDATAPVWFKTYRATPEALDFENVDDTDDAYANSWGLGVTLDAEPFAYGERVTIPTFTVNNDPAAATNPCLKVLPEILGDAPAQARYDMTVVTTQSIPAPMFAVTPVDDSFFAPLLYQIGSASDGVTTYTDTGAPLTGTGYVGGTYRETSFATNASLIRRLRRPLSSVRPGRYALLLRVARAAGSASTFTFQAVMNGRAEGRIATLDRPAGTGGAYRQWVDLGTFAIPTGMQDYTTPAAIDTIVDIRVGRSSGTSALGMDALVLMPVEMFDGEAGKRLTTYPDLLGSASSSYLNRWDGDEGWQQIYRFSHLLPSNPAYLKGDFPPLVPGRRNVFHLFRHTDSAAREDGANGDLRGSTDNANSDQTTMQTDVTISYRPRWLYLAAG